MTLHIRHYTHGRPCRLLSTKTVGPCAEHTWVDGEWKTVQGVAHAFHAVRLLDTGERAYRWGGEVKVHLERPAFGKYRRNR